MEFRNHKDVMENSEIKECSFESPSKVESQESSVSSDGKLIIKESSSDDRCKEFRKSLKETQQNLEEGTDGRLISPSESSDDSSDFTGANSGRDAPFLNAKKRALPRTFLQKSFSNYLLFQIIG